MTAILFIIAVAEMVWTVWNYMKAEELAEKEEWLDKRDISLDERANKLAQWENELRGGNKIDIERELFNLLSVDGEGPNKEGQLVFTWKSLKTIAEYFYNL